MGDEDAVLVVDETGDLKKGIRTVAVQRQYTGTAGRIEECPGRGLPDLRRPRRSCAHRPGALPSRSWTDDPDRCRAAGIPDGTEFATKPALARKMITRALDAGTPARWIAGDEVYGADPGLRGELEDRRIGQVLAVTCSHRVRTPSGPQR
jgi:SRSO17 transposase